MGCGHEPVNAVQELQVTWGRAVRIWWAYIWTNLIAIVVVMVVGFVAGLVLGFILRMAGVPLSTITLVTALIGAVMGLAISVVPIKMILGKDFGEFRLVLKASHTSEKAGDEGDGYT